MTSQAASFSGVLTTTSQLAITIGIAAVGALYLTAGRLSALPPMSVVLLALASTQAVTGMGVPTAHALLQRR